MTEPIGRWIEVELRGLRDEAVPGTPHARAELGTRSPKADQGSHTWSAGTSGFSSGTDVAAGSGSLVGIGSGLLSVARISWDSWSAVGSGSLSAVGMGAGSGSGVVKDGGWGWMLTAGYSSISPTMKEDPSTHRVTLLYLASVQQEFPHGTTAGSCHRV